MAHPQPFQLFPQAHQLINNPLGFQHAIFIDISHAEGSLMQHLSDHRVLPITATTCPR